jgi:hypothetical protein
MPETRPAWKQFKEPDIMPATHPLARYAAMVVSRNEPFRTHELRGIDAVVPPSETQDEIRSSTAAASLPRQRTTSVLLSKQ